MEFMGGKEEHTEEISRRLKRLRSSKDAVSPQSLKGYGGKAFQNEGAGSNQWLSGGEEGDDEQFEVLRDVSRCMEKFYDSQESEPSDAETLSSATSDSDGTSYSDYNTVDSGEDNTSFDDNSQEEDGAENPADNLAKKGEQQHSQPIRNDTYVIASDIQPPCDPVYRKTVSTTQGIPDGRNPGSQTEPSKDSERRRQVYVDARGAVVGKTHTGSSELYGDSSDSELNLREPNNNTLKSNLNYLPNEKHSDNRHSHIPLLSKENRKSSLTKALNRLSEKLDERIQHRRSQAKYSSITDAYSVSMETDARYDESMVARAGSKVSSAPSYQSPSSEGTGRQRSKGQWEITGHQDSDDSDEGCQSEQRFHEKARNEMYTDSPYNYKNGDEYVNSRNRRLSTDKQTSIQKKSQKQYPRQLFMTESKTSDTNASPLNVYNPNNKIHGLNPKYDGQEQSDALPVDNNVAQDLTFDKYSKKDSGISSFMEDTCHSSDSAVKVLTVKNLKTFNDSFNEKTVMNISMNQSDLEQKAEIENAEKVKQWLCTFQSNRSEELMSISDVESDVSVVVHGRSMHWAACESSPMLTSDMHDEEESQEPIYTPDMLKKDNRRTPSYDAAIQSEDNGRTQRPNYIMHNKDNRRAPLHNSAMNSEDNRKIPLYDSAINSEDNCKTPKHNSAMQSGDSNLTPTHTSAVQRVDKSRAPARNSAKHGGGDSRIPVHNSANHSNDHNHVTPVHISAKHSNDLDLRTQVHSDSRIPVHDPSMHSEHRSRGVTPSHNSATMRHNSATTHGEEKSRIPIRGGHKRHTSGHTDKVDVSCQTLVTSPMQVQYSGRSPHRSTPSRQPRSPMHGQSSTPRQKGDKFVKDNRVIKKVARCLNKPDDSPRRSSDIGAMMRNVYGSADSPMKLKMREDGYSRNSSGNSGKRLAEESEFEPEWNRDEFSSVGLMPTPPKSRKINPDKRSQGPSMLASPCSSRNHRSVGSTNYDGQFSKNLQQQSGDQTTSGFSDGSIYVQFDNTYTGSQPGNARLSVSDPHCQSHYERSHTYKGTEPRNSIEARNNQCPEQRLYSRDFECCQQNNEVESSPMGHFDRHESRQSRDSLKGTSKEGRSLTQNSHSQRSLKHSNDKLPERHTNTQPQYGNHCYLPHTFRCETGYSELPMNRYERPQNIYRANLMQDSIQDFDSRGSSSGEVYNSGRRSDALANQSRRKSSESENAQRHHLDTDQQHPYDEIDGVWIDAGNIRRFHGAENMRRKSGEYIPYRANMINRHHTQSPGHGAESSAGMRTNNTGMYNESDTYRLPRQNSQSQRRQINQLRDSNGYSLHSPRKEVCRNLDPEHRDGQFESGANIMQHDHGMLQNVYSPRKTDKLVGKSQTSHASNINIDNSAQVRHYQTAHDTYSDNQGKQITGHQSHQSEAEQANQGFLSPHVQRNRIMNDSDHTFSPSGSMAKLRLNTPKSRKHLCDESRPEYQNTQHDGADYDENMDTVYSNRDGGEMPANSRDTSLDSRKMHRHNSGEVLSRSGRYVENLSDKENDYVERDRAGFISLDEISSVSGQVSVQRYNKSPRETSNSRCGKLSDRTSGQSVETVIPRDRISPRYKADNGAEGFCDQRASRSPRETTQAYTPSGSARVEGDRGIDVRMDSFDSSGSERRRSAGKPHSRAGSTGKRNSSMSERDGVSPNLCESKSHLPAFKVVNSQMIVSPGYREERTMTSTECSYDTSDYMADRSRSDTGRSSNRTKEDMLVRAEQQNHDYNVAHVRKMDVVKKPPAKQNIKKSLFDRNNVNNNNRNVATPVNFTEFAEGISSGGISEPISKTKPGTKEASGFTSFKVPFNKSPAQSMAKRSVTRNLPTTKTQQGYGDVMSSTMREASRRHLSEIRNRVGNFVHSTPINMRAPLMLNETISTIQASDETENVENEEVVVLI